MEKTDKNSLLCGGHSEIVFNIHRIYNPIAPTAANVYSKTTRRFYLAVRDDLLERTRQASSKVMAGISVANLLQVPFQT